MDCVKSQNDKETLSIDGSLYYTTAIWCVEYLIIYYKKGCLSEKEHVLYAL